MLTWEPFTYHGAMFPLSEVRAGRYDAHIAESAQAAAAWGHPILLRFAHEMNGDWYPWGAGVGGNEPRHYKRAWRHVVRIFRAQGADQVRWVWAPQVNRDGKYPFRRFYPGDRWVDWVGLDGYNSGSYAGWRSFDAVFGTSYGSVTGFSRRPMLVTETGTSEEAGAKPLWVLDALRLQIPRYPRIRAVVWFNDHFRGGDFRIASSRESLQAFRDGIGTAAYSATSREDLVATPARFPQRRP
jgi:beta-mannanase